LGPEEKKAEERRKEADQKRSLTSQRFAEMLREMGRDGMEVDLTPHKGFAEAIAKAEKVVLYEGLPHQQGERNLRKKELREKEVVWLHGHPYYAETPALKAADVEALTALVSRRESFHAWGGMKWCGGYHPDYLIEWSMGKETYQMAVCLGCHEV